MMLFCSYHQFISVSFKSIVNFNDIILLLSPIYFSFFQVVTYQENVYIFYAD